MLNKKEALNHKILEIKTLKQQIKRWRLHSQKIVFTNGCFDILHCGHIKIITEAASLGDKLIVAINTDASVKRLKGEERPINDEKSRAIVLSALQYVDAIILFDEDTPLELIQDTTPDVLVKGGDYTIDTVVGAKHVMKNGGEVVIIPTETGFATTNVINKIKNS
jgi:rfaE bifunctional protein nucleotidyltransferase chain/domain